MDGTTDCAINYESCFITINKCGERPKKCLISVNSAASHTSDAQVDGTINAFNKIASTYSDVQIVDENDPVELTTLSSDDILRKTIGMNSDHAEDQKAAM